MLVLVTLFLFVCINMNAQQRTYLFNQKSRIDLGLNSQQSDKLDTMLNNDIYLNHFFVEVKSLVQIHEDGKIYVNLPDKQIEEMFVGKHIEYKDDDDFVYYGKLDPCDDRDGSILLIEKDGSVFGQINIEEEIYELQDFGGHKNVLFKIDPMIYTESECAVLATPDSIKSESSTPLQNRNSAACDVRVLVLFTPRANLFGFPENVAINAINRSNIIAKNSDANIKFTLAGVAELQGFQELNLIDDTLDALIDDPVARNLRFDVFEADVVVLLTARQGGWMLGLQRILGVATLDEWQDDERAHAIVEIDAALGNFTFTHELAHIFGCKHHDDNRGPADGMVFSARGHTFNTGVFGFWGKDRITVMRTLGGGERIEHFSNPDVKFRSKKTGTSTRNNAQQLSDMACIVADYVGFTPPFSVRIDGPLYGNNFDLYTWCLDLTSCNELSSVTWEYSVDGINYFTSINAPFPTPQSSGNYCVSGVLPWNQTLYIRVNAICIDGTPFTAWTAIFNYSVDFPCDPNILEPQSKNAKFQDYFTSNENFMLYPNPAKDIIYFETNLENIKFIEVYDNTGRLIDFINLNTNSSRQYNIKVGNSLNLSQYKPGTYYIRAHNAELVVSQSFIKHE
jgi:hypothetical protein